MAQHTGEGKCVAGARVEAITSQDWKVQSGMKGCDLEAIWLIVVAANSI
jgi:hypothetical protein